MNSVAAASAEQCAFPPALDYVAQGPDYTPGRSVVGDGNVKIYKLSSNESALGVGPMVVQAIIERAHKQHLYPDPDGLALAEAIAARFGLDAGRILIGPGSDTIINWIIRGWAAPGDEIVYSEHGFQSYRIRAMTAGVRPVAAPEVGLCADIDALLDVVTDRTRVLFVANPNNPTGTYLPPDKIRQLRERLRPNVMLVVDEAYAEYVERDDYGSALSLAEGWTENVIVTRTFSKFYALAGMRVGWAYAPRRAMGPLSRMRGPFSVSGLALAAAVAALKDTDHNRASLVHNRHWHSRLQDAIGALGFNTTDSAGNFVLMQVPGGPEGATEFDSRLRALGCIGRIANQNALPDWLRLTVGTEEANRVLLGALRTLSNQI